MAAYVIVDVRIHDPVVYEEYRRLTPGAIAAHGGKFIVRGGAIASMEGGWDPERIVVLEFPSVEQAKKWYASPEYAPALKLRQQSATSRMIIVDGV